MSREPEHLVDGWVSHEALRNEARRERCVLEIEECLELLVASLS